MPHYFLVFFETGSGQVVQVGLKLVVHCCNPRSWEAEAGRWLVPDQHGLPSETLPQKINSWAPMAHGCNCSYLVG
jgi:hypothetical protein